MDDIDSDCSSVADDPPSPPPPPPTPLDTVLSLLSDSIQTLTSSCP